VIFWNFIFDNFGTQGGSVFSARSVGGGLRNFIFGDFEAILGGAREVGGTRLVVMQKSCLTQVRSPLHGDTEPGFSRRMC
jgi:hypothetical protein